MHVLALSNGWFYLLLAVGSVTGLTLLGLVLGFGIWLGHGYWQARADRVLAKQWQDWYDHRVTEVPIPAPSGPVNQ
jgi:hypothetical protein